MPGILRHDKSQRHEPVDLAFDRSKVLENTQLNAKLGEEGERLRERLRSTQPLDNPDEPKKRFPKTKAPTALRKGELDEDAGFTAAPTGVGFDEHEIQEWDRQRGQTEKIIEPNTPYMGTAADTEYYDEDPVPDDLDLGGHV